MMLCTSFKLHARRNARWLNPANFSMNGAIVVTVFIDAGYSFMGEKAKGMEDIWRELSD
jgi:hypothetical protein